MLKLTVIQRPQKKASTTAAAATPSADADNPPPTPNTPMNPKSFTDQKNNLNQASNAQAAPPVPAPAAAVAQPQPEPMVGFPDMGNIEHGLDMNFGNMDSGDVLEQFDFDAFLQGDGDDLNFDNPVPFGNYDGIDTQTADG